MLGCRSLATVVGLINVPRSASRSNRTIVALSSFATNKCRPDASIVKNRGVLPRVSIHLTDESRPVAASTENTPMLSCPRLLA